MVTFRSPVFQEVDGFIVISGNEDCSLKPQDLPDQLLSSFGKYEVEEAAQQIVSFCKAKGEWCPFTIEELADHYRSQGLSPNSMFFGLIGAWFDDGGIGAWWSAKPYLAVDDFGQYRVTDLFIRQCANALAYK